LPFAAVPLESALHRLEDAETVADTARGVDGRQRLQRQPQLPEPPAIVLELLLEVAKPTLEFFPIPRGTRVVTHQTPPASPDRPPVVHRVSARSRVSSFIVCRGTSAGPFEVLGIGDFNLQTVCRRSCRESSCGIPRPSRAGGSARKTEAAGRVPAVQAARGPTPPFLRPSSLRADKIGRASCRERV